jgi:hypothetical protein
MFMGMYTDLRGAVVLKDEYDERPYGSNSVPKLNNHDMFEKFKNEHGLEIWNN